MKKTLALLLLLGVAPASAQTTNPVVGGRSGPVAIADGQSSAVRQDKSAALVNTEAHGRYQEPTYRGNVFLLDSDAVTLAAANTTKSAIGGLAKFINGFHNPNGSGKLAVILNANVSTVSGTPAGPYFWNYTCGISDSATLTGTVHSAFLNTGAGASAMSARVNVALTAFANAPALTQLATLGGPAAIAAGAGMYNVTEDVAGRIIVPPGCDFGLMAVGAGTSHVVQSTIAWEEIPL